MNLRRPVIWIGISISFLAMQAISEDAKPGALPEEQEVLPLPPGTGEAPQLKLGEKMKFDELGPVIITETGEARRIENWKQLTKREQEVAWRRIGKECLLQHAETCGIVQKV